MQMEANCIHSAEEIAEILEEEPVSIAWSCELVRNHPDWEDERVGSELTER